MFLKSDYDLMVFNAEQSAAKYEKWSAQNYEAAETKRGKDRLDYLQWGADYAQKAEFYANEASYWKGVRDEITSPALLQPAQGQAA